MIGFLYPAMLIGLGLLAIPIILHLFKPRKVRVVDFSSVRWLRASQHRLSRRVQWHQLLLLALRLLLIALLVGALAGPYWRGSASGDPVDRLIVVDTTAGMRAAADGGGTLSDQVSAVLGKLADRHVAGDRTWVISGAPDMRLLAYTEAGEEARDALVADAVSALTARGEGSLTSVLRGLNAVIGADGRPGGLELVFVTDNDVSKWRQPDLADWLEGDTRLSGVEVVLMESHGLDNAWIESVRTVDRASGRQMVVEVGALRSGQRTVRVGGVPGLDREREVIDLRAGGLARATFDLPYHLDAEGVVARVELTPSDDVPEDDVAWYWLDSAPGHTVLMIEPETTRITELQPGHHLRVALQLLNDRASLGLTVVRSSDTAADLPQKLRQADTVVWVAPPQISSDALDVLRAQVNRGVGLIVFFGPSAQTDFLNSVLHDPLDPATSLLPAPVGQPVVVERARGVDQWAEDSSLLRRLSDPVLGDFEQATFAGWYPLEGWSTLEQVQILASLEGGVPLILRYPYGDGEVIVFNTTANDEWTDLPRRSSFLALVDRLFSQVAGAASAERGFRPGTAPLIQLPMAFSETERVALESPRGERREFTVEQIGGAPTVQLAALDEPGVYQLRSLGPDSADFPFVVRPAPYVAGGRLMDEMMLTDWWAPVPVDFISSHDLESDRSFAFAALSLAPILLLLAAIVFLLEMWFVHRLCPHQGGRLVSRSDVENGGAP